MGLAGRPVAGAFANPETSLNEEGGWAAADGDSG